MKYDYDDRVRVRDDAPEARHRGKAAWIVGVVPEERRSGDFLRRFPRGYVYTIEFEDGSSIELPESALDFIDEPSGS